MERSAPVQTGGLPLGYNLHITNEEKVTVIGEGEGENERVNGRCKWKSVPNEEALNRHSVYRLSHARTRASFIHSAGGYYRLCCIIAGNHWPSSNLPQKLPLNILEP
jgi:hypothetical protein